MTLFRPIWCNKTSTVCGLCGSILCRQHGGLQPYLLLCPLWDIRLQWSLCITWDPWQHVAELQSSPTLLLPAIHFQPVSFCSLSFSLINEHWNPLLYWPDRVTIPFVAGCSVSQWIWKANWNQHQRTNGTIHLLKNDFYYKMILIYDLKRQRV